MNRSLGKWKLPQPTDLKDEEQKEWIQIPRIARTVPFGYKINEEEVFEISKNYSVNIKKLGRKQTTIVVVDDFYKNPMMVRQLALDIPASFNKRIRGNNTATN